MFRKKFNNLKNPDLFKNFILLVLSLVILLISANYTIQFAVSFANDIRIPPVLIGLTILSIGSCLPELFFSIKAVKNNHDELAIGDILGTVIIDTTIILGVIAIISPFYFKPILIYVTGAAMFIAGLLMVFFITSGKTLTRKEGVYLLLFYLLYLVIEIVINNL